MSDLSKLPKGSHVHLIGICGTAMASLAGLLQDLEYKVTGSDSNPYPPMSTQLEKLGIPVFKGYQASNLSTKPDFVIVGNVISAGNPEAEELKRLGIPFTSLPKAMGEILIQNRKSIVVSGTHGKTTTTSLMAWVAETCGVKPGFLIGGIPKNFAHSFQVPFGDYFVIEGDEYDTAYFDKVPKFVHYKPSHVILTSIEFDHADIYADLDAVKSAFRSLMKLIPTQGVLVYCAEDENIPDVLSECRSKNIFSYGIEHGDWRAHVLKMDNESTRFSVTFRGQDRGEFEIGLGGTYNVLNALAVIAMSESLGFPAARVHQAFKTFAGVKRRQEVLGEPDGVLVIEDFAHHPTAVKETIEGLQKKYAGRRFFSVFEPRSATSRRKVFQSDYVKAFGVAHEVLIAKAFDQSKIDEGIRFSSEELVEELNKKGKSAAVFESADAIVQDLLKRAKPGDAILIMSNGGFDGIYQKLLQGLTNRSKAPRDSIFSS